ncbi:MAG: hypothetical protein V2A54_07655 [Bacteroidota bacterium]
MRRCIFIISVIILGLALSLRAQNLHIGLTYSPMSFTRLVLDKDYVIFSDYTSKKVGNESFHFKPTLYNWLNSGFFIRYEKRFFQVQCGANINTKAFCYSREWDDYSWIKSFFYYTSFDVPVTASIVLNPNRPTVFRLLGGLMPEFGKLKIRNYSSALSKNLEGTNTDMLGALNNVVLYSRTGLAIDRFGNSFELYLERNLTELQKENFTHNANMKESWVLGFALGFKIPNKDLRQKHTNKTLSK